MVTSGKQTMIASVVVDLRKGSEIPTAILNLKLYLPQHLTNVTFKTFVTKVTFMKLR